MKKIILSLFLIISFCELKAGIVLVNNTSGANALYTSIDAGLAAANPSDTIYVSGSNIIYGVFTITKSIVIIGPGSFSQKQNAFSAKVNGFSCNSNLSAISIKGLHLVDKSNFNGKTNISQLEISGNYFANGNTFLDFNGATNFSFVNISNNVFGSVMLNIVEFVNASGFSNVLIQNNLFFGNIRSLNALNSLVSHNVFINIANSFDAFGAYPFANVMIKDNIFYNSNPIANTTSCTYNNNLSFSTTQTFGAMNGTGNLDNVNPDFVNVLAGNYTSAFNFHLLPSSPAIGASSTGDDIGYYGGTLHADVSGETENMPVIRTMDIQNPNVISNGNVNVKVRSTKAR